MTEEEIIRLRMETTGREGVVALDKSLADLSTRTVQVDTTMKRSKEGSSGAAMGLMQLAQAADDVQYGFRGIVNNIPGVLMGLGMGTGLAGGIAIVSVGVNQLINRWDDLKDAFGFANTRSEAGAMEALGKATSRTAQETEKLNNFKRDAAEIERLAGLKPEAAGQMQKAFSEAIAEGGGFAEITGTLARMRIGQAGGIEKLGAAGAEEEIKTIKSQMYNYVIEAAQPGYMQGLIDKAIEDARARVNSEFLRRAQVDVSRAGQDPRMLQGLISQVQAAPGAFRPGLAAGLVMALPENVAALEENKRAEKEGAEAEAERKRVEVRTAKAAAAAKKAAADRLKGNLLFRKETAELGELQMEQRGHAALTRGGIRQGLQAQAGLGPYEALVVANKAMGRMAKEGESEQVAIARALNEFLGWAKRLEVGQRTNAQIFLRQADNVRALRTGRQG